MLCIQELRDIPKIIVINCIRVLLLAKYDKYRNSIHHLINQCHYPFSLMQLLTPDLYVESYSYIVSKLKVVVDNQSLAYLKL